MQDTGGAATVTLTEDQIPEISGSANIRATAWGSNSDGCSPGLGKVSGHFSQTELAGSMMSNSYYGTHPYTILTYSFGGGEAHNNLPPYYAAYIYKRVT